MLHSSGDLVFSFVFCFFSALHFCLITCQLTLSVRGIFELHSCRCCFRRTMEPRRFKGCVFFLTQSADFSKWSKPFYKLYSTKSCLSMSASLPCCKPGNPVGYARFVCCLPQQFFCLFQEYKCCCWKNEKYTHCSTEDFFRGKKISTFKQNS